MDPAEAPRPARRPPSGVPRWLWPPPGATVTSYVLEERRLPGQPPVYRVAGGLAGPDRRHLRALEWLLEEHGRAPPPAGGPFAGEVRLSIARTEMAGGRVGHAYALGDGPLGAPGADGPRGVLWRWIAHALAHG